MTEGEEVRLFAKVSGNPNPEVEWQKDGKTVRDGRRTKIEKDENGLHSIRIPYSQSSDQGEYMCIVKNRAGKVMCSAKLIVHGK